MFVFSFTEGRQERKGDHEWSRSDASPCGIQIVVQRQKAIEAVGGRWRFWRGGVSRLEHGSFHTDYIYSMSLESCKRKEKSFFTEGSEANDGGTWSVAAWRVVGD